ncbi:MAG: glycosyltransferase [Calditrichaeota bacterium]|nr:MAG: glycosyltransferase [Calditrichota bacterium]
MLNLIMPIGASFGWGICGKMIALELLKRLPINYITSQFTKEAINDQMAYHSLQQHVFSDDISKFLQIPENTNQPILQAIAGNDLNPWGPEIATPFRLGYTFFENNCLPQSALENARKYDFIATGSSWCREVLQSHGIENTTAVLQGIDTQIFNPCNNQKEFFQDKFVVFSGGKFEFRKSQDIVIAVMKRLMAKYDDVILVNSWYNLWPETMQSILQSPHIAATPKRGNFSEIISGILAENNIDTRRVVTLPLLSNAQMAQIYKNSDIALFPNRCEGGTNLVLMEYMVCGKPAIVSNSSGHKDIISNDNAILINKSREIHLQNNGVPTARWQEPDLDETYALLENAYLNRSTLDKIGVRAGLDLEQLTWGNTAAGFLNIFEKCGVSFHQ